MVTVYHGTAYGLLPLIQKEGLLAMNPKNPYVYLTTHKNIAEEYAASWISGTVYNFDLRERLIVETGAVLELQLDESVLQVDDFDLRNEPHQYKVLGHIPSTTIQAITTVTPGEPSFIERNFHVEVDVFHKISSHWVNFHEVYKKNRR